MRLAKKLTNQRGLTLIEIIVYIALLSIVLLVVFDLLLTTSSLKSESESNLSLQKDESQIINRLNFEIKQADTIATPSSIGQTTASLSLTTGTETHTLILVGNNLVLQKTLGASTATANLNSDLTAVSALSFQRLGNTTGKVNLKINFTLTNLKTTQQGTLSKNYQMVVTTR